MTLDIAAVTRRLDTGAVMKWSVGVVLASASFCTAAFNSFGVIFAGSSSTSELLVRLCCSGAAPQSYGP